METKIAFSGIGGVGGYYGGTLAGHYEHQKDVKIYFISRGENLKVIREKGLQIRTPQTSRTVHPELVTDRAEEIGEVDYLFCTTKSYDLEENIRQLKPLISAHTVIIPLLNGADITERIRELLPGHKVWYGCVYIWSRLSAPGTVTLQTEEERLWFGNPQEDEDRQKQLLEILTQAGINAQNPSDIIYRVWKKFFLISISATLTSYYNQSIGDILKLHREDYYRLGNELRQVAQAKGISLPEDTIDQIIAAQEKVPYDSTTSMHADFKNGKKTEVETLTGYVVKSGHELHIPVPAYEMMYDKLKSQK